MTDMETFKSRLFDAAQHAGVELGQSAIAKSLGINKQTVDGWFRGGKPSAKHLPIFAQMWGVSAEWLLTGKGEMVSGLPSQKQNEPASTHDKALQDILRVWDTLDSRGRIFLRETALLARENFGPNARRNTVVKNVSDARSSGPGQRASNGQQARRRRK